MPRDPFDFDDFFVQDYVATIESITFAVNDFSTLQANIANRYDEPIVGDDGEVRTERYEYYNVGGEKDWEPADSGTAFQHVSLDPDKRIRSNSAFGELVTRIGELVGKDDLLSRSGDHDVLNPLYCSDTYEGLRFHWATEGAGKPYSFKDRSTGEQKTGTTRGRQMPVEYLPSGLVPTPREPVVFDVEGIGLSDEMMTDLAVLARGSSFGEFQRDGISFLKDLHDDAVRSKLVAAFSDNSFYEALRTSSTST